MLLIGEDHRLTWIFHDLRLLKIRERGYFTIVGYVERPMTGSDCKETPKEIQQYQVAQRVSNFDKKKHGARLVQIVPFNLS